MAIGLIALLLGGVLRGSSPAGSAVIPQTARTSHVVEAVTAGHPRRNAIGVFEDAAAVGQSFNVGERRWRRHHATNAASASRAPSSW